MAEGYKFRKQVVAVMGANGQVGHPLTKRLLELGHEVKILSRRPASESPTLQEFETSGATVIVLPNFKSEDYQKELTEILKGADSLICAVPASPQVLNEYEPVWLDCAVKAGVKRFVPTEFGCHTRGLDVGDGVLFDAKKVMHEKIFKSGIGWTFFYNGGFFDYFLPNLRFFDKLTTFGKVDIPIYTHKIEDIGRCAAMALTDDRTINKCVQMDYNFMTQQETLDCIKKNFPDESFEYEHYSTEFIIDARKNASDDISSKKGAETDLERWGINYVIYVLGKLVSFTDETLRTSELYPDFVAAKPEDALKDPEFVLGKGN